MRPIHVLSLIAALVITAQISCNRSKPSSEPQPAASPTPTQDQMVNKILDRYQEAVGGKDAVAAITSYKLKGTFEEGVRR
jgi:hypothetical protein